MIKRFFAFLICLFGVFSLESSDGINIETNKNRIPKQIDLEQFNLELFKKILTADKQRPQKEEILSDMKSPLFDPNYRSDDKMPLSQLIVSTRDRALIQTLLDNSRLDLNVEDGLGMSLLEYFLTLRYMPKEIIYQVLSIAALKQSEGRTLLHDAAQHGQVEVIRALHTLGDDVNALDQYGRTPMHYAAQHGQVEAIRALHTLGANVNARDLHGRTPLRFAAENAEVIRVLRVLGAEVAEVNVLFKRHGQTPLIYAIGNGRVEAIGVTRNAPKTVARVATME